ncbi:MAG: cyclic nucleotide-binding domain-containing protein [Pseudomonadota bacterium]|nr:cyclic nucleotide-binding domain-containing protein [Pseudomonadota bacterium]HBF09649.1 cyclic nucleotide-binding protein [Gammaproteobacteria bacterium]|tara:strand:- start:4659 stop:5699 length:1041 start_codon:yes stop_codon:yes gene_type:complete
MTSPQQNRTIDIRILQKFVPLNALPDKQLKDLSHYCRLVKVSPKTLLFKRGAQTKEKFYLLAGEVDLCDENFQIRKVNADAEVGFNLALNSSSPTSAAAIATTTTTLLLVDSDRLDLTLTWSQAGDYVVEDIHEDEEAEGDWMSDLLQSNLLQKIPTTNIQQLFISFKQDNFKKGHDVIKQGDAGDYFYVLQSGSAQVYRTDENGEETDLATLQTGRFFGEEALISDNPRNASVRMLTDGSCMKLDKATFNKLLKEPVLNTVTSRKVKAMQLEDPKVRVVDLRSPEETQAEPLENVMHIPFTDLRQRMELLDKSLVYVTHFISGRRAELGAYLLSDFGFDAYVMKK